MKKHFFKTFTSGQTLVEVVVVVGMVVLLATGLVAGTTASLKSAQSGRIRSEAVTYAQQALEAVRAIRDRRWSELMQYSGLYCMGLDGVPTPAAGSCSVNITGGNYQFSRSVRFQWQDPKMVITATVSYVDGTSTKDITLVTYLTQWK